MANARILIVDDDTALLQALPRAVSMRMASVQVDTSDSALTALELIQAQDYDAIVSDIKMPDMDGLTLLSRIQELRPDTPTLLITGHGENDLAIQALRGGAYDFIQKPIDRDYVVASLRRAIQTHQMRWQLVEQQRALEQYSRSLEETVRALRESEERFRNIFAEAPIGMAVVSLDGMLLQVNKAFGEMLGYGVQELAARSLTSITHPEDIGKDGLLTMQMLNGVIASYKVEKRYLRKNQETLWADLTAMMLRNQDGQPIYRLVMIENIIERKRAKLLEEEQRHIAYELHDGLAQVAASTYQHLQALASRYRPHSPQARQNLSRALELAQLTVREARQLIAGLRPTILDDFGLATALRLHVEALCNDGWTITYNETLGSERLSPMFETTLFRVAQEALTNTYKHAGTLQARLALERRETTIHLEVQDWGCGFEPLAVLQETGPGEHVGLREMQERVQLIGGNLTICSHPGAGTLIVAEVPLLLSDERSISTRNDPLPQWKVPTSAAGDH
ncbi:MAG TPA: response regulator [Ktedonobacteraceae bacterium]